MVSSRSKMAAALCPVAVKVNLFWGDWLHFGDEVGEHAQREGGRWWAGRAGRWKQESRGGATGERGRASAHCPQGVVSMTVWF